MRLSDLSPSIQYILIGLVAVALAALLTRAILFIHRERVGVRSTYPPTWSAAQCRTLEQFRLLVGLALIPLWGAFLYSANWPFEFWDVFFLVLLLLISNAWVRLITPRNWEKVGTIRRSFRITMTLLVVWWGAVFTATGWVFATSILSTFSDRTGTQTFATSSDSLLIGKTAYGDWRLDAPGIRRHIRASDLPAPYASGSAVNLVSVVGKPPDARLNVPVGFKIILVASGLKQPRLIRVAPNGDIFIAESRAGRVRVLRPSGSGDEVSRNEIFASGLKLPFGIAFYPSGNDPQWVYVANTDSVVRFHYHNGDLRADEKPEVIVPMLPHGGNHWTRDIAFSLDDTKMFISVGSASNDAESASTFNIASPHQWMFFLGQQIMDISYGRSDESERADVLVFNPKGEDRRIYASGIRNCVGMAINPTTGDLWCSTNERDGLGDDLPPDYITRVREDSFYGWPWYYIGAHEDPLHVGARPDLKNKVVVPDILIQPHSASMQMMFYTGNQFPAEYEGNVFAAEHGSWNRAKRTGYKIIRGIVKDGVPSCEYEDFVTGFVIDNARVWGRPVGIAQAKDGSLLFCDDGNGTIWRVSYVGRAPQ